MVHRQLGLWLMLCILYKLLQLIKNIKVSGGGLIVTLGATALKRKVTGILCIESSFKMVPKVMQ